MGFQSGTNLLPKGHMKGLQAELAKIETCFYFVLEDLIINQIVIYLVLERREAYLC